MAVNATEGLVLSVVLTDASSWAQQPAPWREFIAHSKAYAMFAEDLAAMGKATPDNLEGAVGTDLMKVVLLANELCGAARDLLMMRDLVRAADGREGDQFLRLRLGQHARCSTISWERSIKTWHGPKAPG